MAVGLKLDDSDVSGLVVDGLASVRLVDSHISGSGRSALDHLKAEGCDTLITGELREEHFNEAHEQGWNLYPCGHYATETWGVKALAAAVAAEFDLKWEFIPTGNPL
jgi:putative NIF3 family GTP cyclohydrolase 1 type 2